MNQKVLAVIGIVALVIVALAMIAFGVDAMVSRFLAGVDKDRREGCENILKQIEQALKMYQIDHGQIPQSLTSLNNGQNPQGRIYFDYTENGVRKPIVDPWGRPFVYRDVRSARGIRGPNLGFRSKIGIEFYSVGSNGVDEGGSGDDITIRD